MSRTFAACKHRVKTVPGPKFISQRVGGLGAWRLVETRIL